MRIGVVSTRLSGTDGVSLESAKVCLLLKKLGHELFYFAGELSPDLLENGYLIPEAHFRDPFSVRYNAYFFAGGEKDEQLEREASQRVDFLREKFEFFVDSFHLEYCVFQNVFAIPMQILLARALAGVVKDRNLPGIAHSHDFYWERERFSHPIDGGSEVLSELFPPVCDSLCHAVINSKAQKDLKRRRGVDSVIWPNVLDFKVERGVDSYNCDFREQLGLVEKVIFLQPTRVVPRKGIQASIDLVARLGLSNSVLLITHHAGDEGLSYFDSLRERATRLGVDMRIVADRVDHERFTTAEGLKGYSLWDTYPHCDFALYPSLYEGFGNALIECVYFRLPTLVNTYSVYVDDIQPCGFNFVEISDGIVTDSTVDRVRQLLEEPELVKEITEKNWQIASENYSMEVLMDRILQADQRLNTLQE